MRTGRLGLFGLLVVHAFVVACGPKAVFQLSADENNRYELGNTLQRRELPAQPTPVGAAGPRVYALVTAGGNASAKTIVAHDLATGNAVWKADGDVQSRIAVGGDFIVALEGKSLVARDAARGAVRWKASVPGTYIGHAADRDRVYAVFANGTSYTLVGYAGADGDELWKSEAAGRLGAPGAHGGIVYVPFLSQWLSLVDGKTGTQLTRIRGIEAQISLLRVTSQVAYFGSKQGVFQLDVHSASGKRSEATYGAVTVPPQLELTTYGRDMYDPVQTQYTAFDRARLLWSSSAQAEQGPLRWSGEGYAVHYFRFVFGFALDGTVRWAYSHPRVELVASEHTGSAIAGISTSGEIVALDPASGAVRAKQTLGTAAQTVLGATFDADGWSPAGEVEKSDPVAVLVAIARDGDARFDRVKELAVAALGKRPEPTVTAELLGILADKRAPVRVKDAVVEVLIARKDPEALPVLVAQLAVRTDYIAQTEPDNLGIVAKAIAGLRGKPNRERSVAAVAALRAHLDAPTTAIADLVLVIEAMGAIGDGAERSALGSHLLLYHADDALGGDAAWQKAIVSALVEFGGPQEREILRYVAEDPRTRPGLVETIRAARL